VSSDPRTVLIVDDSALMRAAIRDLIAELPGFCVIGTASDGREGIAAVRDLRPDVVTLDVEMPELDGLAALAAIMRESPRPVVMLSGADADRGVDLTIRALELGAVDFVRKPGGGVDAASLRERLDAALRAAVAANVGAVARPSLASVHMPTPQAVATVPVAARSAARAAVTIVASTGGPKALADVVAGLPEGLDAAVLIAQHMPRGFTTGLARRLNDLCALPVREARHGEVAMAGCVYLAPGGQHLTVRAREAGAELVLEDSAPVWGVKPAGDPLFVTAAHTFRQHLVGVVLTGMGRDGALGLSAVRESGGGAIVEDATTAAVNGMPREALTLAGADLELAPQDIGAGIVQLLAARTAGPSGVAAGRNSGGARRVAV